MLTTFALLRIIAKAIAKNSLNAAALGFPVGNILFDSADEAIRLWKQQSREEDRQAELWAMAQAAASEVRSQLAEIIRAEFTHLSQQGQQEVLDFLAQVPENYRRKCTRRDAAGHPAVVAVGVIGNAKDLVSLFPEVPPNFKPGTVGRRFTEEEIRHLLERDHSINGGLLVGMEGYVVEIQGRAMRGLRKPTPWPGAVKVSGMARGAVGEAMDRLSGAFAKLKIPDPQVEVLVNLYPADLIKEGTWLDLPLAIVLLQAAGSLPEMPEHRQGNFIIFGEIGIHGEVRRVPGALSIAYCAKPGQHLIVPAGNEKESGLILYKPGHEGCHIFGVSTLEEVVEAFQGRRKLEHFLREGGIEYEGVVPRAVDFGAIKGQARAKGAACIAAAGGHNLLLIGPPGEGKSLLASALPGILPPLTREERVQLTKLYSAYGALGKDGTAVSRRPMRAVHHTISKQALVGGGSKLPRPGEITLAHLGVLFLDEIAEFSAATLDALRQPMETGEVHVSRVGGTLTYPCRFTLVAAMNPCPCGYHGSPRCRCRSADITRYQKKISGPILDRIDLQVQMTELSLEERFAEQPADLSPKLRARVQAARDRQRLRFASTDIPFNAAIPAGRVLEFCDFSSAGLDFYKQTVGANSLTTRSVDRLAKVARTVADLADSPQVEPAHVVEAARFVVGGLLRG